MNRSLFGIVVGGVAAFALALVAAGPIGAASHREAPLISLYPASDITDFFMFRSYEQGHEGNVVFIMDVFPGEEPSAGPNYFHFDPSVVYSFHVDNDGDGIANDLEFQFQFQNEVRGFTDALDLPLAYVGCAPPAAPSCTATFPPITTLNDPGIGLRQRYTVKLVKHGQDGGVLGKDLIVVPSNVGPRTMPNYPGLARQGVYDVAPNVRVFAGQRQDPFYIDLGAAFDTLNLRRPLPLLTPAEDENDNANSFGMDMLAGFNVHTIALEVPASLLTKDGKGADDTTFPAIGAYASTTRPVIQVQQATKDVPGAGREAQIQRLANPLVNELIIGTPDKDVWNTLPPWQEEKFAEYYLNPRLATALTVVYGVPAPDRGRQDLVDLLLKYAPTDKNLSELLRLRLNVPPTPFALQRRMGPFATPADPAAWPNGRRPKDDVTDIAIRAVGQGPYIAARAGDGVNTDDARQTDAFPFLAEPANGRDRTH